MIQVKIKPDKYGNAIGMLIRLGGGFQTRHERILVVNSQQLRILEDAGFVESNGTAKATRKPCASKAK